MLQADAPRPPKKRRLDAAGALCAGLGSSGEGCHASDSSALDLEALKRAGQGSHPSPDPEVLARRRAGSVDLDPARQAACGPPEGAAGGSAGGGARKGSGGGSGLGVPLASEPGPLKSFGSVQALCAEV